MKNQIALFKLDGSNLIPTEVCQTKPTLELNKLNKYEHFKIGYQARKSYKYAMQKGLHYYKFMKSDLNKSSSILSKGIKDWNTFILNKEVNKLRTNVFDGEYLNPLNATEIFLKLLIDQIIEILDKNIKSKEIILKILFTAPPYSTEKRKSYYSHFNKILQNILPTFTNKKIKVEFPELNDDKYYLYEQFAVYYYYSGISKDIEFKKKGSAYLIIDGGASTTDIASVRITKSEGDFPANVFPKYETIEMGGNNIDRYLLDKISNLYSINFSKLNKDIYLKEIEEAKINLLTHDLEDIRFIIENKSVILDQKLVHEAIDYFYAQIKSSLLKCIIDSARASNLSEFKFDKILLAGGMASCNYFVELLKNDKDISKYISHDIDNRFVTPLNGELNASTFATLGHAYNYFYEPLDLLSKSNGKKKTIFFPQTDFYVKFITELDDVIPIKRKNNNGTEHIIFSFDEVDLDPNHNRYYLNLGRDEFTNADLNLLNHFDALKLFYKDDRDLDFNSKKYLEVMFEDKIKPNSHSDLYFSCQLKSKYSKNWTQFEFQPSFYIGDEKIVAEVINPNIDFNTTNLKNVGFNDILVSIDLGMSNTSVAMYSNNYKFPEEYFDIIHVEKMTPSEDESDSVNTDDHVDNLDQTPDTEIENNKIDEHQSTENFELESNHTNIEVASTTSKNDTQNVKSNLGLYSILNELNQISIDNIITFEKDKEIHPNELFKEFKAYLDSKSKSYNDYIIGSIVNTVFSNLNQITILAGPPGVGKTSLVSNFVDFFSEYLKINLDPNYSLFRTIQVSPSFITGESLLGSFNHIQSKFYQTEFTKQLIFSKYLFDKLGESSPPVFILLDEFNIAHPEQYLASVLSGMEFESESKRKVILKDKDKDVELPLSPNLKIFATINTDATSKMLSPKVIDRSVLLKIYPEYNDIEKYIHSNFEKVIGKGNKSKIFDAIFKKAGKDQSLFNLAFDAAHKGNSFLGFRTINKIFDRIREFQKIELVAESNIIDNIILSLIISKLPADISYDNSNYSDALILFKEACVKYPMSYNFLKVMLDSKRAGQLI